MNETPHNMDLPDMDSSEEDSKEWLMTYADMVTLLLAFFVLLLSISAMDIKRFEKIAKSLQYSLGTGKENRRLEEAQRKKGLVPYGEQLSQPLIRDFRRLVRAKNLGGQVDVVRYGNKITLRVEGKVLFKPGSAELSPTAQQALTPVAAIIKKHPGYRLDIKGHSDSAALKGGRLKDNWELSALRATSVLRFLLSQGVYPGRMTATGLADTEPLAPETSVENMAKNRRVEFVLERTQE